jgi:hypothetical protein
MELDSRQKTSRSTRKGIGTRSHQGLRRSL